MIEIGRKTMMGSDGRSYIVLVMQEMLGAGTLKKKGRTEGMRYLELEDGREVISLDNRDMIQGTDIYLTEID